MSANPYTNGGYKQELIIPDVTPMHLSLIKGELKASDMYTLEPLQEKLFKQ